ncbi:Adenylosuccinate lyase [Rhynchospora pubera]|uniref:Adenylosuccinate lyase n=1 Tax=Rhynchospora pubera TaxID=906938 RepID=A0AAV8ER98_9POAL|nr:Adenylosuccinate lyase [Rhynchospora pubera]
MEPIDDAYIELSDLDGLPLLDSRDARMVNEQLNFKNKFAFVFYRVLVEVRWLLKLSEIPEVKDVPTFSQDARTYLENIIQEFNVNEALEVKKIEEFTNHDVKAIVYYLKQKCKSHTEVSKVLEFFHFVCTSADINNLAYGLLVKNVMNDVMFPVMTDLCKAFCAMAKDNANMAMPSHFHGQRPSPTTLGKEMATFAFRLGYWAQRMSEIGLVLLKNFVASLGLEFNPYASQIESHHYMVELFDNMENFNKVLVDFTYDVQRNISLGYFEQRDLTPIILESTELGFAHSLVAYKKILQGIKKLQKLVFRVTSFWKQNLANFDKHGNGDSACSCSRWLILLVLVPAGQPQPKIPFRQPLHSSLLLVCARSRDALFPVSPPPCLTWIYLSPSSRSSQITLSSALFSYLLVFIS